MGRAQWWPENFVSFLGDRLILVRFAGSLDFWIVRLVTGALFGSGEAERSDQGFPTGHKFVAIGGSGLSNNWSARRSGYGSGGYLGNLQIRLRVERFQRLSGRVGELNPVVNGNF